MITDKTSLSLQAIARAGGSLTVCGDSYTSASLQAIARAGKGKGATLRVENSDALTSSSMQAIARANPGYVEFA